MRILFPLTLVVFCAAAAAQDYPNRPVRMLVPNAPGSSVDTMSRILSAKLGEALGAAVVVENRDGAGGLIGMDIGKNAKPDGRDFEHIGTYAVTPNVLVVSPQLPVKSVKELIEYARANSATINMASAGIGSQSHLAGVLLMTMGNFESLHVPHKGGGPSVNSVAAGQTHWTMVPAPAAMSQAGPG